MINARQLILSYFIAQNNHKEIVDNSSGVITTWRKYSAQLKNLFLNFQGF